MLAAALLTTKQGIPTCKSQMLNFNGSTGCTGETQFLRYARLYGSIVFSALVNSRQM